MPGGPHPSYGFFVSLSPTGSEKFVFVVQKAFFYFHYSDRLRFWGCPGWQRMFPSNYFWKDRLYERVNFSLTRLQGIKSGASWFLRKWHWLTSDEFFACFLVGAAALSAACLHFPARFVS